MSWQGVPVPFTDRDDWLAKRRAGIGASDVAGIVGLSPYVTPFTVWAEKVKGTQKTATEAMDWGRKLEDVVLDEYQERTGLWVYDRQLLVRHPKHEWAMATLDGVAYESTDAPMVLSERRLSALNNVEVKTDGRYGRWSEIPDHYQIQTQWQMFVTGMEHTTLVCLHGGRNFEVYELSADDRVQQSLYLKAVTFRERFIEGDEVPEVDESDYTTKALSDLWRGEGDELDLSQDLAAMWEGVIGLEAEKNRLEADIKKRKNQMKAAMGDHTVALVDGMPVATWKSQDRKGYYVDPKEFRVLRRVKRKDKT